MSSQICIICRSEFNLFSTNRPSGRDRTTFDCSRCGSFSITEEAARAWKNANPSVRQRANASGWMRENTPMALDMDDIEGLFLIQTPSFQDRVHRLLHAIHAMVPTLDGRLEIKEHEGTLIAKTWCANREELDYLLVTYLVSEAKYLQLYPLYAHRVVSITPKGYAYLDESRSRPITSQIGFCAMWFDPSVKPIWTEAIAPAILAAGYEPKRIDSHQHNNRIDDEIIAMIRKSRFVVADFTAQREGVYFEAGYALGHGLPVIWTVREDHLNGVHFDNRQYNFTQWNTQNLAGFRADLQFRIEATIGRGSYKPAS